MTATQLSAADETNSVDREVVQSEPPKQMTGLTLTVIASTFLRWDGTLGRLS